MFQTDELLPARMRAIKIKQQQNKHIDSFHALVQILLNINRNVLEIT
ncbi:protein of unknown function [Denitratisoma oestradiolicum]|uniref:Uncharacterized protein n=1 Tax=Denitratisoma oestradiolicum TaxID=311182 RepID=A0A6S6XX73_9PROT|nr:protein of unknown function [Denitratisoma oestradiolicum]